MSQFKDLHLVIRSSGERTATVAVQLAVSELRDEARITVITETPFENALRRTYEIGLSAGRKWTMTLDADILLLPGRAAELLEIAEATPDSLFQIQGRVYDKVTGFIRSAGPRIYRTELLDSALKHIPDVGVQLRPEYHTICAMGKLGFPSHYCVANLGVHDFEQYFVDLYRKAALHSAKHRELISDIITRCTRHRATDPDYSVILKGLWDGLNNDQAITVDATEYTGAAAAVESLGLREKEPMEELPDGTEVLALLHQSSWRELPMVSSQRAGANGAETSSTRLAKVRERLERRGVLRGSISVLGAALKQLGSRLDA